MVNCICICELPQDCLAKILSLTSPGDVVRSSAVSKLFFLVSQFDHVWDAILSPLDNNDIISRTSSSLTIPRTKKDLFFHISRYPLLFDDNTKSLSLDKWSGKICYMLGARALSITWGDTPDYWTWEFVPNSRFPECAKVNYVFWLEIKGRIRTSLLSQGTTYGAYLMYKNVKDPDTPVGFGGETMKVFISRVGEDGFPIVEDNEQQQEEDGNHEWWRFDYPEVVHRRRDDGWMETEMGRCEVDGDDDGGQRERVVELEILSFHINDGLVVQGIELRPLS